MQLACLLPLSDNKQPTPLRNTGSNNFQRDEINCGPHANCILCRHMWEQSEENCLRDFVYFCNFNDVKTAIIHIARVFFLLFKSENMCEYFAHLYTSNTRYGFIDSRFSPRWMGALTSKTIDSNVPQNIHLLSHKKNCFFYCNINRTTVFFICRKRSYEKKCKTLQFFLYMNRL